MVKKAKKQNETDFSGLPPIPWDCHICHHPFSGPIFFGTMGYITTLCPMNPNHPAWYCVKDGVTQWVVRDL
jgi:hypothetical protein